MYHDGDETGQAQYQGQSTASPVPWSTAAKTNPHAAVKRTRLTHPCIRLRVTNRRGFKAHAKISRLTQPEDLEPFPDLVVGVWRSRVNSEQLKITRPISGPGCRHKYSNFSKLCPARSRADQKSNRHFAGASLAHHFWVWSASEGGMGRRASG